MAGPEGFEPSLTGPKPAVLPLDDGPVQTVNIFSALVIYQEFLL